MLRLFKFLAAGTAIVLFCCMVSIAYFYNYVATHGLIDLAARQNVTLDSLLRNTFLNRYDAFLWDLDSADPETLRSRPEIREIETFIRNATIKTNVLKVKIYNVNAVTVFSTSPADIGQDYSGSAAVQAALRELRSSSELTTEDFSSAFSGEAFGRDVVETYIPYFDAKGRIAGAFEIYSDVTDEKTRIDEISLQLFFGLALIFSLAYVVLVLGVMRRAVEPIKHASAMAQEISPASPGRRLPTQDIPEELLPLVTAMNGALDRLDGALDAQRRFTADAAHELLTPLAIVRAQLEALGDIEGKTALLADIDAMKSMARQLLQLAEAESGGAAAIDFDEVNDLSAVARDVIASMAPAAVSAGKELSLSGATAAVPVKASGALLVHVIRNLVENALRHTPRGTEVDVNVDASGVLRISDHGPGVPTGDRERIFDRFWRAERNRTSGAGLGLSIVKRFVQLIGGEISVESAPEGGACFVVKLRRA